MNTDKHMEREYTISALENRAADDIATVRLLEQQWDDYREVMHENTARFEEAGIGMGAKTHSVHKGMAARRELDSYVGQLAYEQAELLAETAREIRSHAEFESERLRREKAGTSWG
ncbi:hypothetical protein [Leifsonia sp. Root227]|uniref:hypothetical protein n=2 Tax=unclassified Leifsonia TaxID=2663824 RepID=UPI000A43FAE7|nr:hypothetical protein [Leifsonia sp. Root227]